MTWEQIAAIVGVITGVLAICGLIYNRIYRDARSDFSLKKVCDLLEKYNLPEMHLMITTMWQAYTADLPRRRPDLAQEHSRCALLPAGLDMIPAEVKGELDKIELSADDRENVVTGYLVAKIFGIDRISTMAKANQVLVQEMIGILGTYLDCRLDGKKGNTLVGGLDGN